MRVRWVLPLLPALLVAGCAGADPAPPTSPPAAAPGHSGTAADEPPSDTFLPYTPGATAITYDPAVVPPGATAQVTMAEAKDSILVHLSVAGMIPRRAYGAHLHAAPCAALPSIAGPHYQHRADPTMPSVDPSYANPVNEVWLDFTAGTDGTAAVDAVQPWTFAGGLRPHSLVVHAETTRMQAGAAGTAGPRVACLTLPAT